MDPGERGPRKPEEADRHNNGTHDGRREVELGLRHTIVLLDESSMNPMPNGISRGTRDHAHENTKEAQTDLPKVKAVISTEHQGERPKE